MNKAVAAVLAVVLLGGGAYYFFVMSNDSSEDEETVASTTDVPAATDDGSQNGVGTWASLLARGQDLTCDFRSEDVANETTTEGTVYIAGERMRGDFTMLQAGETYEMSVIRDSEYAYTWGASAAGAMAIKVAVANTPAEGGMTDQDPFESDVPVEYSCARWSVDEDKLTPPSDIDFLDMSAQLDAAQNAQAGAGVDIGAQQCAACDQAPADVRDQCRAALGC